MSPKVKQLAMGLAVAGLALLIYNKVPAVKRMLGGA